MPNKNTTKCNKKKVGLDGNIQFTELTEYIKQNVYVRCVLEESHQSFFKISQPIYKTSPKKNNSIFRTRREQRCREHARSICPNLCRTSWRSAPYRE